MSAVADKVKDMSLNEGKKDGKKKGEKKPAGSLYLDPQPEFIDQRIAMFDHYKQKYDEEISKKEKVPIKITLKDGSVKEGTAYETSPMDIANSIGKSFAERQVISKVDGQLWDMPRPLEGDAKLEFLDFDHPEGKAVFWHSSAHILGEACECHYGCHLTHGPPTDDGFFYDMSINNGETAVTQADFPNLEQVATKAIKEKQKFERLELTKEQLLEMFKYNKYKIKFISDKIPDGTSTTVYRCGPLIDLCVGPHIPHSGRIKAFKVLKNSASYFLGDSNNDSLQRVYGISFPDKKLMTEHLKFLAEAAERDHRKIGREQELFFFSEMSPGSAMWLPHGTRIYNTLVETLREEYRKRGYDEVITPNMYSTKLWETSGHWQNYKENMFSFEVEKETFGLKPMNCLSEDMRVQTNKGFLALDEVKDQWRDLKFANYNPETKQIQYLPASNFILKDAANHKMVEFSDCDIKSDDKSNEEQNLSMLVTQEHDMYVQTGKVTGSHEDRRFEEEGTAKKVPAGELVDANLGMRFVTAAAEGVDVAGRKEPLYKSYLGVSEQQNLAFLQLYGFWLGQGATDFTDSHVTFSTRKSSDFAWLREIFSNLGFDNSNENVKTSEKVEFRISDTKWRDFFKESNPPNSGKSFADWVWKLNKDELRAVIAGIHRADGDENNPIYTSSYQFRDELVQVLLHAGYTADFSIKYPKGAVRGYSIDEGVLSVEKYNALTPEEQANFKPILADSDSWSIRYAEDGSPEPCVNPVLYSDKNVRAVDDYFGRVWCVTVPTGLIIVQRVVKNAEDVVVKASRPTIVGNCPGHAVMFKSRERSYRDLPWRVADFGVIHRNEFSGALSGLTRVRRFQQDDAHIFCTTDQIGTEIAGVFDLLKKMYGIFGFEFKMELSTRPEKYVGDLETWDAAELKLENALDEFLGKGKWELNPGDGAFYGPKIDIMISDALKRWFQCATIQLDFQLPQRFELEYKTDKGPTSRPVMIHRAILGSVERMTAILTEHYKGKWPFWLSPRQILIVPVGPKYYDYAQKLQKRLNDDHMFYCDVDVSGNTLPKKIRTGQMYKYNFIFIVGDEEEKSDSVNVRNRDIPEEQGKNAMVKVDEVVKQLLHLKESKRSDNKLV
jgi:threonyl-tRNA synthetase